MHDPALYDMLHRETSQKQISPSTDRDLPFNEAFEKSLNDYVDILLDKQDPVACKFISSTVRREKIENEDV